MPATVRIHGTHERTIKSSSPRVRHKSAFFQLEKVSLLLTAVRNEEEHVKLDRFQRKEAELRRSHLRCHLITQFMIKQHWQACCDTGDHLGRVILDVIRLWLCGIWVVHGVTT